MSIAGWLERSDTHRLAEQSVQMMGIASLNPSYE
jgi:hypothetical protein